MNMKEMRVSGYAYIGEWVHVLCGKYFVGALTLYFIAYEIPHNYESDKQTNISKMCIKWKVHVV